jgi:hypothetical protein
MNTNPSQADKILRRLQFTADIWVSMPDLSQVSGAYAVHSRIAELRKRGHVIENRTEQAEDGTRLSWYRLVTIREVAA